MFGIGKLVLGEYLYGILFLIIGAVAAAVVLQSVGTGQSRANSRES
jgi:hypothetical protein